MTNILELRDGLTMEKIEKKYPWILKAVIKDVILGENDYGLIWYKGIWEKRTWVEGTWEWGNGGGGYGKGGYGKGKTREGVELNSLEEWENYRLLETIKKIKNNT